ncbi:MAG: nucleotidyltransferase domain-containing protein [Armatimonadetes bacterium]|nr:nucleotidyltransferase domain-containing protein [Armatimonadota bacterium]
MITLTTDELSKVQAILARLLPDREVCAFGSRATGRAREFSDLDLAVMGDEPLPPPARAALREAFAGSTLPFRVDIVDWCEAGEPFRTAVGGRLERISPVAAAPQTDPETTD